MAPYVSKGKGSDWDKGHNVYCLLDALSTNKTVIEEIAKFFRESRIGKVLIDKTIVYESHVRRFGNSMRYEEENKMIHSAVRKKDENGNDVDLEIMFGVEDITRVLELGDSDNDPTIIPERLCKGLWCRMGFTGHVNGKMIKTMFSHAYKFMIHCVVHALSHRKGAYDETFDYIMNIITCFVLNRPYNISKVIFEYLKENIRGGSTKYIMYPRFMQIDDQFKDIQPTLLQGMIDGKRKRTPKTSLAVPIPKEPVPKIVVKGPSKEPQQRLVEEKVLDPSSIPQEGAARDDSSEDVDDESTETETELDPTTLGRDKAQLKKKPTKKQKGSDEEDSTYVPPKKSKKIRAKRKAVQYGVLPRKLLARKGGASLFKDQEGKKEKHVSTSKVLEAEKAQSVETSKGHEVH
ncbi:hypothetical protein Hanom_Chr06g00542501 [Helianthus anomalus]